MALYICASGKSDDEFFEEYEEFQKMLFDKKEEMAARIGKIIDKVNLCDVTIQELLEVSEDEVLDKVTSRNRGLTKNEKGQNQQCKLLLVFLFLLIFLTIWSIIL